MNEELLALIVTDPLIQKRDISICVMINKLSEFSSSQEERIKRKDRILDFIGFTSIKLMNTDVNWKVQMVDSRTGAGVDECIEHFETYCPDPATYAYE